MKSITLTEAIYFVGGFEKLMDSMSDILHEKNIAFPKWNTSSSHQNSVYSSSYVLKTSSSICYTKVYKCSHVYKTDRYIAELSLFR